MKSARQAVGKHVKALDEALSESNDEIDEADQSAAYAYERVNNKQMYDLHPKEKSKHVFGAKRSMHVDIYSPSKSNKRVVTFKNFNNP